MHVFGLLRRGAYVAGVLMLAGCYSYLPVEHPATGSVARVRVPIRSALSDPNAQPETAAVEGEVLAAGDTIFLATKTRQEYGAYREIVQYDTFRVARDGLVSIELREFSSGKSIALGVALAGAVTFAALAALGIEGGQGGEGNPGDGTNPTGAVILNPFASLVWSLFGR